MNHKFTHIEQVTREDWIKTWASSEYGTFYEHPDWFDAWRIIYPNSDAPFAIKIRLGQDLHGLIPCFARKLTKGFLTKFECSPGGLYAGPLGLSSSLSKNQVEELTSLLSSELINFSFRFNPLLSIDLNGSSGEVFFTQLTDLSDRANTTQNLSHSRVTYDSRFAQKKGLQLKEASAADLQQFFGVYQKLRSKWTQPSSTYPSAFFDTLIASKHSDFWSVHKGDEYIGGGILLKGPCHVSSWLTIMDPDKTKLRPYEFMYSNLLSHYSELGFRWFDFNPSNGLEGVVRFKEKFASNKVFFGQIEKKSLLSSMISTIRGEKS